MDDDRMPPYWARHIDKTHRYDFTDEPSTNPSGHDWTTTPLVSDKFYGVFLGGGYYHMYTTFAIHAWRLGLEMDKLQDLTEDTLSKAFRRVMRWVHPDKRTGNAQAAALITGARQAMRALMGCMSRGLPLQMTTPSPFPIT